MQRILCFLGLHKWFHYGVLHVDVTNMLEQKTQRVYNVQECKCCGQRKLTKLI